MMLVTIIGLAPPAARAAATPQDDYWITDGSVYTTALIGQAFYVGGQFTYIGPNTGAGTQVNAVTAKSDTFPRIIGQVHAAVPDGNGGWYVGGSFSVQEGGVTYANLVHIIPTTTSGLFQVDSTFTPGVGGDVTVLVLSADGATLYVGGSFSTLATGTSGQVTRNNIAAVAADTGSPDGWDPDADGRIDAMVLDGQTLYVGGAFTEFASSSANPVTRNHIAALKISDGSVETNWDPDADGEVKALVLSTDNPPVLYAAGAFTHLAPGASASATARAHVAALTADVTQQAGISTWSADTDGNVNALSLASDNSSLYLGGAFQTAGGKARQNLARVDTATAVVDDTWTPAADGDVYTLQLLANDIVAGGAFTHVGSQQRQYIAEINTNTGIVATWNPSAENIVRVVDIPAPTANGLFVGGDFISVAGAPRNNLAALNTVSLQVSDWNPNVRGTVRTLVPSGTAIFIGGDFDAVGGAARNHFAAVDPSSGAALADWAMNVDGTVYALALKAGTLYAGGAFTVVGTGSRSGLAAFDTQSSTLTGWAPRVGGGDVRAIALSNADPPVLYAGGSFTTVNGSTRGGLAAVDTKTGALVDPWTNAVTRNTNTNNAVVYAVALSTDNPAKLYAGGDFGTTGTVCSDLAEFDAGDGSVTGCLSDPDGPVHALALAVDNVLLYAGGAFTNVGGAAHAAVAAITVNDGNVTAWTPAPGPSAADTVRSLELANDHGTLYMGGDFTTISGLPRRGLAVFQPPVSDATPGAGAYNSDQSVKLSCTDPAGNPCTGIWYSTDGTVPSTSYGGNLIGIDTTTTLRFYGIDSEGMREVVNAYNYVIDSIAPTVSASPAGGSYTDVQSVTLTCTDNSGGAGCAAIYYTTDGSTPTTGSTQYGGAISLSGDTVLKFLATDAAGNQSSVHTVSYTIDATAPQTTPSPAPGTYTTPQTVTLTCDDGPGSGCAGTYYTLDGSVPTLLSPKYTQPLSISANTTLNYFSVDKVGHQESPATAVYLIQTGTVVTSGGGLFLPPRYLLAAGLLALGRRGYLRRRRRRLS